MTKPMKVRTLTTLVAAAGAAFGVTACKPAVTACTVRHHYAIAMFQNGGAGVGNTVVTQFRLNVRYSPYFVQHWIIGMHIVLRPVRANQLPVVVRTFHVGHAHSCSVDRIRSKQ
jgi:hypothetical protein